MTEIYLEILDDPQASAVATSSETSVLEISVQQDVSGVTIPVLEFLEITEQGPQGPPGPEGPEGPTGQGITFHPDYAGLTVYFGPGPLPDPEDMPNTVYIVLPS